MPEAVGIVIEVPITNAHLRAISAQKILDSRPVPHLLHGAGARTKSTPLLSLVVQGAPSISHAFGQTGGIFSASLDDGRASAREALSFLGWTAETKVGFSVRADAIEVHEDPLSTQPIGCGLRLLLPLRGRRRLQIASDGRVCMVAQKSPEATLVIYPESTVLSLLLRK